MHLQFRGAQGYPGAMSAQPECRSEVPDAADALPAWMHPPRDEGWIAEDLDALTEAPAHTELIDGALVFMMSAQRSWHTRTIRSLGNLLERLAPAEFSVEEEMTVTLDRYNRPEPDVVVAQTPFDPARTSFIASEILLAVEVVPPESAHRGRAVKPEKYAAAGIPHFWRVECEADLPVVHAYELDATSGRYAPAGIHRKRIDVAVPFPIEGDLTALLQSQGLR
ncbi:Uma2 family endonuclease [Nocardiopsis coralliicola]